MKAIIGDVHGCYHTLIELHNQIKTKYPQAEIYCVGDLVDRGVYSAETIQFIMDRKIKCVLGNHDCMFYFYFSDPNHEISKIWDLNGNATTLHSYMKHQAMLDAHLEFIGKLPLFYNLNDCLISHAGISTRNYRTLNLNGKFDAEKVEQFYFDKLGDSDGILWNRDTLADIGKMQIVGHTKKMDVVFVEEANALYIDTGAYSQNKLSAVIIEEGEIRDVLSAQTVPVDLRD